MLGIDKRALQIAWTVFLFGLFLFLAFFIRETLLVFAAAIFFAYILSPIVSLVERFLPKRRTLALALVYILLVGALVGVGFALIPKLKSEAETLAKQLPGLVSTNRLATLPLPAFVEPIRAQIMAAIRTQAAGLQAHVVPFIQQASTEILSGVGSLVPMILIPILAFFFLKDARDMRKALLDSLAPAQRLTLESILGEVHLMLQSYMRALVILAAASFTAWAIFLSVLGEQYELLLAGTAGVLEFIPVIGPAAALVLILVVSGVAGSGGLLWIIVFWALYRVFQDYVLNPYLMSAGVEIHPLLVLFGVLAGEKIGGIPGMFFSVPVLAILKVVLSHLRLAATERQLSGVR
jgi:predicted PurR-regulated permease PerM